VRLTTRTKTTTNETKKQKQKLLSIKNPKEVISFQFFYIERFWDSSYHVTDHVTLDFQHLFVGGRANYYDP